MCGKKKLRAIKYLFTTCPSDSYLFHENSISKYLLKKYSNLPGDWIVQTLMTNHRMSSLAIIRA